MPRVRREEDQEPCPQPVLIEILERAVAAGVTLDSDGAALYVVGAVPSSLAPLIESHRPALIGLLAEQRRRGAADCWGEPGAVASGGAS